MFADPGRMLGKYQLIAEIARGGMGVVYLAMVQGPGGFNKLVVVKELKPELVEEPAFLMMFLDEARLAARLSHPNIVQTNEVGNDGDRYFMAMDYLDGRGLDHVRRRSRTAGFGLTQAMHLRVLCDVLSGLDYAHRLTDFDGTPLNIVHRDVSPQNVFLTFDGQVKLLDFGIAKANDSMHETHAGVVKGKVSYMSPEQGRGQKVDARADVFSAGVLMWEALTGKRMREGKNDQEKLWALVSEDIPRASKVKPSIPKELDDICYRAMAWNRDDRYASASAVQRDIERWLTQSGTAVTTREVGDCVSSLFKDDRVNTNNVIEAYVARARQGAARDQLPVIDVVRMGMGSTTGHPTPSGAGMMSGERSLSGSSMSASHSLPPERGGITSLDLPNPRSATNSAAQLASMPQVTIEQPRSKKLVVPAIAAAVVAAVIIFFVARSGGHDAKPAQVAAAAGAATAAPPPPPPAQPQARTVEQQPPAKPQMIDVEVRVSPETATVSIDGKDVDGNPFSSQYPSDDVVHHIRASAPGYIAKSRAVVFNGSVTLDLSLERNQVAQPPPPPVQAPPPPVAQPTRPRQNQSSQKSPPREAARPDTRPDPTPANPPPAETKPASSGSEIDPNGGNKPRRPIELNNPYGGAP